MVALTIYGDCRDQPWMQYVIVNSAFCDPNVLTTNLSLLNKAMRIDAAGVMVALKYFGDSLVTRVI